MKKNKKGMTLIELLAVIAIIAILFILLIPQINSAIEKSRISGVQTDFHSYEVAARGYLMEVGDGEKTEEGLNRFLDKNLKSNSGEATEKGPWGHPYKIKVDNEKKQFVFTTLDKNKEPRTHKMIVSWGDEEIKSKYTEGVTKVDKCGIENSNLIYTEDKYFTISSVGEGLLIYAYGSGEPKDVVIPCEINGKKVIQIGTQAFKDKSLNSVILPNTLEYINTFAFSGNKISELIIGKGITKMDRYAFQSNNIKSLVIPSNFKTIGEGVFANNKIEDLILEEGVETIGDYAFAGNFLKEVTIPSTVTVLGYQAFYSNPDLKKVVNKSSIPNDTLKQYFSSNPTITN